MIRPRHALALALVPLLFPPRADELVQKLQQDAVLVRTFETTGTLELGEIVMEIQGEDHAPDEIPPVTIEVVERVVVTDELATVEEGRARRVRRTYDELVDRSDVEGPEESESNERTSPLEGETVIFTWDADEEEWSAAPEDEDLDTDLVRGLRADLSFAEFLPSGEVVEGDSWEVPVSAFALLFLPAGELSLLGDEEEDPEQRARVTRDLIDEFYGEIVATYAGTREEDGVEVGVIELVIEVESEAELSSGEQGTQTLALERDLEGELLWDLAGGRMHALRVDGDSSETMTTEGSFEAPDGSTIDVLQSQSFEGARSYRFRVEKR